jgi:uncharacterized membrane protein YdbT with pleckstrin-like domain
MKDEQSEERVQPVAGSAAEERLLWSARPSWWLWAWHVIWVLLLLAVAAILVGARHGHVPIVSDLLSNLPPLVQDYVAAAVVVVAAIWCVGIYFSRLSSGRYRVTNIRAVERHGFFSNVTNEIRLRDIRGVNTRQSFWQKCVGIGSVWIASAAGETHGDVHFLMIPNPEQVKELIHQEQLKQR